MSGLSLVRAFGLKRQVAPIESWRTLFGAGSLPTDWTFANPNGAGSLDVSGDSADITIPTGVAADSISSTSTPDNSVGIVKPISGDFDVAFRIDTFLQGDSSSQLTVILRGATDAEMVRFSIYAKTTDAYWYAYQRSGGSGSALGNFPLPGWLKGHPYWVRLKRTGTSYEFFGSSGGWDDGSFGWQSYGSYTSSVNAETIKLGAGQYGSKVGFTLRIDQFCDVAAAGTTDLRPWVPNYRIGTTESTDFATDVPSWLSIASQVDGSAVHSAGKVTISTAAADGSRATITYNGAGYSRNAGIYTKVHVVPGVGAGSWLVVGLAVDDGGPQIDQYADTPGYINEVGLTSGQTAVTKALTVRRPIAPVTDFNESYTFLQNGVSLVSGNYIFHYRIERYEDRFRIRHWADGSPEPSDWVYDGSVDPLRGEGPIKPYISISHNDGSPSDGAVDVLQVDFYRTIV